MYTWPEAWDLMVNHGKKMIHHSKKYGKVEHDDELSYRSLVTTFDKERCVFMIDGSKSCFYISQAEDGWWTEYEEPKKFEWRTDKPPVSYDNILIETEHLRSGPHIVWVMFNGEGISTIQFPGTLNFHDVKIKRWSYIPE